MKRLIIYFFILFLLSCKDKHTNIYEEVYMYNENELEYAFDIRNKSNTISFLLNKNNSVSILIFKDKKVVNEFIIKSDESRNQSFVNIVKKQLEEKIVFNQKNLHSGCDLIFSIGLGSNRLFAKYQGISNFKKEISPDFENLLNSFKNDTLINTFLNKNINENY